MLYSLISFAKLLVRLEKLEESIILQLRRLRPRRVIPPRKIVLCEESKLETLRDAINIKRYEAEYSRLLDRTLVETFVQ